MGITSHFYIGESAEDAYERFYPYYESYLAPRNNRGRGWQVDQRTMRAAAGRGGALMVGGPEEVTEKIADLHRQLGVTRFLGQADLGGMPAEMVHGSISRFGEIVAPALRPVPTH